MSWPVLVINLDRSTERLEHITNSLNQPFVRVPGVDGNQWTRTDVVGTTGRPVWNSGAYKELIKRGILSAHGGCLLVPGEVGCALGHRAAWEYVVHNNLSYAVILEDDIVLGPGYVNGFEESIDLQGGFPNDGGVYFLGVRGTVHEPSKVDVRKRLISGWGNYGYVITGEMAKTALRTQFPMFLPCDVQWWKMAFRGYCTKLGDLPDSQRQYAYVADPAIVELSEYNKVSTMTSTGKKPWQT
jgi:GR25 family glycosyltransferase involved in LPS biosynthesis